MSDFVTFLRTACLPAQIYLALVLVNILFALLGKFSRDAKMFKVFVGLLVGSILIGLAFTWVANYLCQQGWAPVAWLFVLLPLSTLLVNLQRFVKK